MDCKALSQYLVEVSNVAEGVARHGEEKTRLTEISLQCLKASLYIERSLIKDFSSQTLDSLTTIKGVSKTVAKIITEKVAGREYKFMSTDNIFPQVPIEQSCNKDFCMFLQKKMVSSLAKSNIELYVTLFVRERAIRNHHKTITNVQEFDDFMENNVKLCKLYNQYITEKYSIKMPFTNNILSIRENISSIRPWLLKSDESEEIFRRVIMILRDVLSKRNEELHEAHKLIPLILVSDKVPPPPSGKLETLDGAYSLYLTEIEGEERLVYVI